MFNSNCDILLLEVHSIAGTSASRFSVHRVFPRKTALSPTLETIERILFAGVVERHRSVFEITDAHHYFLSISPRCSKVNNRPRSFRSLARLIMIP